MRLSKNQQHALLKARRVPVPDRWCPERRCMVTGKGFYRWTSHDLVTIKALARKGLVQSIERWPNNIATAYLTPKGIATRKALPDVAEWEAKLEEERLAVAELEATRKQAQIDALRRAS